MGIDVELDRARADAIRYDALVTVLDLIEQGELTPRNGVRRLRTQYARAWREYERPHAEAIANAYAAKVAARRTAA
jgi:hypothetical protein